MISPISAKWNVLLFGLLIIAIFSLESCSSSGNGGNDGTQGGNTCVVPPLTEDWEDTYYQFTTQENGDPLIVISDGQYVVVGAIYHEDQGSTYPMALSGLVVDELTSDLTDGTIDRNWNGTTENNELIDAVVEGTINISGNTIEVNGLSIGGSPIQAMTGSCVQSGTTSPQLSSVVAEIGILYDQPPESFSCDGPGWDTGSNEAVYRFRDPIRIGDDEDYNSHHSPDFKISSPSGKSYSKSFDVSSECNFSKAEIEYTIAGAVESARIYLNDSLVGRTRNPGNSATAIASGSVDITDELKTGSNELKISTVLYPGDEIDPYDDIEIYNLRVTLTR